MIATKAVDGSQVSNHTTNTCTTCNKLTIHSTQMKLRTNREVKPGAVSHTDVANMKVLYLEAAR